MTRRCLARGMGNIRRVSHEEAKRRQGTSVWCVCVCVCVLVLVCWIVCAFAVNRVAFLFF